MGTDRSREGTGHGERQEASCWLGNRAGKEGFGSRRAVRFWLLGDFFLRAHKGLRELCKKGL